MMKTLIHRKLLIAYMKRFKKKFPESTQSFLTETPLWDVDKTSQFKKKKYHCMVPRIGFLGDTLQSKNNLVSTSKGSTRHDS